MQIRTGADLRAAQASGRLGVIFGFQDSVPIGTEITRLDLFDLLGVRIVQLTYNKRNLVGDGCLEPGNAGLSVYGREVVAGPNERRMMVDVSHAAQRKSAEAIAGSRAKIAINPTECLAPKDRPRHTHRRGTCPP